MSFQSLSPAVREIAERVLTEKQRWVFERELSHWSPMQMARTLRITKGAVKDRLHNAHKNLLNAGVRQDEFGRYTIEEEAA